MEIMAIYVKQTAIVQIFPSALIGYSFKAEASSERITS